MSMDPQSLQQAWNNLLFGISIPLQLLDRFLPDGWEIALLILVAISSIFRAGIIYARKKYFL